MTDKTERRVTPGALIWRHGLSSAQESMAAALVKAPALIWGETYLTALAVEERRRRHRCKVGETASWARFRHGLDFRLEALSLALMTSPVRAANLAFSAQRAFSAFAINYASAGIPHADELLADTLLLSQTTLKRRDRFRFVTRYLSEQARSLQQAAEEASRWQQICCPPDWSECAPDGSLKEIDVKTLGGRKTIEAWTAASPPLSRRTDYALIESEIAEQSRLLEDARRRTKNPNIDVAREIREANTKLKSVKNLTAQLAGDDIRGELHYQIAMIQHAYRRELRDSAYRACLKFGGLPYVLWGDMPKALEAAAVNILGDASSESLHRMRAFCDECYLSLPPPMRALVEFDAPDGARDFCNKSPDDEEKYVQSVISTAERAKLWLYRPAPTFNAWRGAYV